MNYSHLTRLQPPETKKHQPAKINIDSIKKISRNANKALLISGRFTNGCSYLQKAAHTIRGDTLAISIKAWQPPHKMCTQVMKPFSFIYSKVGSKKLRNISTVQVNERHFTLQ